jgi:glycosyltransferase involved in cell wall biosynthesis
MKKKNKKPYISIITPNLNGEKFLEQTIRSVINQTSNDYEYILIDGQSKDKSKLIINKYIDKIDIFISEKDKSMYHAINKGIMKAKGEAIIWINSDDILDKNAVFNIANFFKKNLDIDWISGINGYIKNDYQFSGIPYVYPTLFLKKGYAHHALWGFVQQESVSFRKKLYFQVGGFNYSYNNSCDYGLWRSFSNVTSLKTVFFKIGFFRSWPGQDSKVNRLLTYQSIGYKKIPFYSLRYFRFIISVIVLPYIIIKTYILTK